MALSVRLIESKSFYFESSKLGKIFFKKCYYSTIDTLREKTTDIKRISADEFVKVLITIVGSLQDDSKTLTDSSKITIEKANKIPGNEIDSISKEFIDNNNWLFTAYQSTVKPNFIKEKSSKKRKTQVQPIIGVSESNREYLKRLFLEYIRREILKVDQRQL